MGEGKVPSEFDMTDGCGWANRRLLQTIGDLLLGGRCPTAVQMRFGGFKVCVLSSATTIDSHLLGSSATSSRFEGEST